MAPTGSVMPYTRGVANQQLMVTLGNTTYSQTVDTGSGLLSMHCVTPRVASSCQSTSGLYNLSSKNQLSFAACAAMYNKTIGGPSATCYVNVNRSSATNNPQGCYFSYGLTGGPTLNVYSGMIGADTVTIQGVQPSRATGPTALAFQGTFACTDYYTGCLKNDTACVSAVEGCPPVASTGSNRCPSGSGLEAGFNFSPFSLPSQLAAQGLVQKVVGFCYQYPLKNSNCTASTSKPTSYVVVGANTFPAGVTSYSSMHSAPLVWATFGGAANGTSAVFGATNTFRSNVNSVTIPQYGSSTPLTIPMASTTTVLWDTGAYSEMSVPPAVFTAYQNYFSSALPKVNASVGGVLRPCNPYAFCTLSNQFYNNVSACVWMPLPNQASAAAINAAKATLLSLYPPTFNMTLPGGAVAAVPTATPVNDCGGKNLKLNNGVAVCSYLTPSTSSGYFWLANPWFNSRFTAFDLRNTNASYAGTVHWSDPIASCQF
ncbi:hypothetical protein PLESTM_001795500 [Pleodorina starrii]|nr:hypothetical protein PLESTM_001795500 [Pleodorina starrii]